MSLTSEEFGRCHHAQSQALRVMAQCLPEVMGRLAAQLRLHAVAAAATSADRTH